MSDDGKERQSAEWIYIGRRWMAHKKAIAHAFLPVEAPHDAGTDAERWFAGKAPSGVFIGSVINVEHNSTSATFGSHVRSLVGTDDRVARWSFEDQSARDAQETERAMKRLKKEAADYGDLTLRQLRELAARQPRHVRTGTAIAVTSYVMAA